MCNSPLTLIKTARHKQFMCEHGVKSHVIENGIKKEKNRRKETTVVNTNNNIHHKFTKNKSDESKLNVFLTRFVPVCLDHSFIQFGDDVVLHTKELKHTFVPPPVFRCD